MMGCINVLSNSLQQKSQKERNHGHVAVFFNFFYLKKPTIILFCDYLFHY